MKLTVEAADFTRAVRIAAAVVPSRNTIPVLEGCRLVAAAGALALDATDMDRFMTGCVPAEIETAGAALVDGKRLAAIAAALPAGARTSLEITGDWLCIAAGRARWRLGLIPDTDWPAPKTVDAPGIEIPGKALSAMLGRVAYAISIEESRYYLCGVFLRRVAAGDPAAEILRAAATDGHRLAVTDAAWPKGADAGALDDSIIVPRNAVAEMRKHAGAREAVTLSATESLLRFDAGDICLITKLITGTFPNYQRIIPDDPKTSITVDATALRAAIGRAGAVAYQGDADNSRGSWVYLARRGDGLAIAGAESGVGDALDVIDAEFDGEAIDFAVNARYLTATLEAMDADTVRLGLTDGMAPIRISSVTDSSQTHVLMPTALPRPAAMDDAGEEA